MGEISDALERAKNEQERDRSSLKPKSRKRKQGRDHFPLSLDEVSGEPASPSEPSREATVTESRSHHEVPTPAAAASPGTPSTEPEAEAGSTPESHSLGGGYQVTLSRERGGDDHWRARSVLLDEGNTGEQFRQFAIRLSREIARRQLKSVAIVSGLRQEGKTTTACNLSLAMSSIGGGRRIALVDLDLRRPSVARYLGLKPKAGIDAVLAGHANLGEVCAHTDVPGLDVYPVAHAMTDAHERIAGQRMAAVLRDLEEDYDLVIVDSPPVLIVSDAGMLAPMIGGCVVVLRSRQTHRQAFSRMLEILPREKLLGVFLNEVRRPTFSRYTAGYYQESKYDDDLAENES